ncbi:hypothetical protein ASPBRDRAFT_201765 [Aspergillus brasiliensis CBS 101740]|uniref:Major facilitator superfamily (MFS) profile domain-containing protein n=1 Tax=Aspergillus brasiliensis (strain CBS 101740 / IMI 381727 / IBT 21946) TaxID=767769 RepID=A0A1L9U1C3_ASPBC|nr:hypothetical protein ASPBRDRAFT_201765 [Aspergillus brasiliensis CBS 101740]
MAEITPTSTQKLSHWRLVCDQAGITAQVRDWAYAGSGTETDPFIVEWLPGDPRNPKLFSPYKKWGITVLVSLQTFSVSFTSSALSGATENLKADLHISSELAALSLSLFVLGFAVGPMLWAPLGELYGRQKLAFLSLGALTIFNVGCTVSPNITSLIILRFLAGACGASSLTNSGGVIADMFLASERGLAMALFTSAPFMGPALGPICGGFLGMKRGWRWVEGMTCVLSGVIWAFAGLLVPETYAPLIFRTRAHRLSKSNGGIYISKLEVEKTERPSAAEAFRAVLVRPWALLTREPIVLFLSLYMAIIYGTLYMLFPAFPIVFQQGRGWNEGTGNLSFLGVIIGVLCATGYSIFDNRRYIRATEQLDSMETPEGRLPPSLVGAVSLTVGLFWFAWTNSPSVHWIVCIVATVPFGFGMVLVSLSVLNYLIDAYVPFAASVLASATLLRSVFGAAFPLFTPYMYSGLGIHWASTVPAFLTLLCLPLPFVFYKYGAAVRARCKYAAEAQELTRKLL